MGWFSGRGYPTPLPSERGRTIRPFEIRSWLRRKDEVTTVEVLKARPEEEEEGEAGVKMGEEVAQVGEADLVGRRRCHHVHVQVSRTKTQQESYRAAAVFDLPGTCSIRQKEWLDVR